MFKNYLTIAFRHLINNRLYSAINIIGLAVGLATCILITLFVKNELSYDQQWRHADSIGRINTTVLIPNRSPFVSATSSAAMKDAIENFFPNEILNATRFIPMNAKMKIGDQIYAEKMYWTDTETADMFDLTILHGNVTETLSGKSSLAINSSVAKKYFGDNNPIGGVLNINVNGLDRDYTVGAVFADLPHNTSMDFQILAKFDPTDFPAMVPAFDSWLMLGEYLVYVQLKNPDLFTEINKQLPKLVDTLVAIPDDFKIKPNSNSSETYLTTIQPLKNIHLNPAGLGEMKSSGSQVTVNIFIATAALVLLIASINFMNLATAKSAQRAREVALRKVVGAKLDQLVTQFLGESVTLAAISLVVGLMLVELSLPLFNSVLDAQLTLSYTDGSLLIMLLGLVVIVGFIAGVYPALVLSRFLPARVLSANSSASSSGSNKLRNALVVIQFSISISLIVATATIFMQNHYATQNNLGFNKESLLIINSINDPSIAAKQQTLKESIEKIPGVTSTGFTAYSPIDVHERLGLYSVIDGGTEQSAMISGQMVDYDFLDTYEIDLLAGRFYSRDYTTDGTPIIDPTSGKTRYNGTVVINNEGAKKLGFTTPQEAIGKHVQTAFGPTITVDLEIIGVTRNIYFQSPKKPIRAETYQLYPPAYATLAVRYQGNPKAILDKVKTSWEQFTESVPFQYEFVDETIMQEFGKEQRLANVLAGLSLIIVLVACLGLYGLAAFTAQQRTKEIGIRKVLGASVVDIIKLLVWQFSKPILIANLIAWPLAIWAMSSWLQNFPLRLESWLLLPLCLASGLLALLIAWLTVVSNTTRVATANPVKALRCE